MTEHRPLTIHEVRLAAAVKKNLARRKAGVPPEIHKGYPEMAWPRLEEDSPDLNAFDNVYEIDKHPRWRWHR